MARKFAPEEYQLTLDGGATVRRYVDSYRRLGPEGCRLALSRLEPGHHQAESSLHRQSDQEHISVPALLYASGRLPGCMPQVERVVVAAGREAFSRHGLGEINSWQRVSAEKRRRLTFFDGEHTLAVVVCSLSDLDDLIPSLCAYQIEWNKLHQRLSASALGADLARARVRASDAASRLAGALGLSQADYQALADLWGQAWDAKLAQAAQRPKDMELWILPLGQHDFEQVYNRWWQRLLGLFARLELEKRPVFLVTSNNHSLVNLISGFADRHAEELAAYGRQEMGPEWGKLYERLLTEGSVAARNPLYLAQNGLVARQPELAARKRDMEREAGVYRAEPVPPLLAEAQVVELCRLDPKRLDPRLKVADPKALAASRAVVLNTDYPLGFGAYHLIRIAFEYLPHWLGLFVLGKSAAMIGRLGDILIPTQVRDVHSARIFEATNCLTARRVVPYVHDAAVFDDQRSLTVHGTFLHSWDTVRRLRRADFTGIEMEAGPCLAALADHYSPHLREKKGLTPLELPPDFSLGILHYTSDTPYNLRASLLSQPLGLAGLESTYSGSLAIWQYILDRVTHSAQ